MKLACATVLLALFALSGLQQAAALRKAEVVASPLLAYPWMPWKNENGVWQKASDPSPDFSKMTLQDLPAPDLYLQVALTSPYAVPQIPLEKVINNTISHLSGQKLPSSAKQWVQMAGNAGTFVAKNMPVFMQKALQILVEGITLSGKPLTSLPALQDATIDASKALKALPQLMNITMMGMDVAKLSAMADKLNIKMPAMSNEAKSSLEDLKKLPALLSMPKDGLTIEDIKKLPSVLEQVATTTSNAADAFAKQLAAFQMPKVGELFEEGAVQSLKSFVQKQINVEIPDGAPTQKVMVDLTKALPTIASHMGLEIEGLDKIPGVIESLEHAFKVAKAQGLVVMDSGRIDVAATLSALPDKMPLVQHVMSSIVPPPADLPKVQQSLDKLQKSIARLADMTAHVMSPQRASPQRVSPQRASPRSKIV